MARAKVTITDNKRRWNQLTSVAYKLKGEGLSVFAGILEEDFGLSHEESRATLGQIATYNEFGTSRIPARSFIRAPFDANNGYKKLQDSLMKRVINGTITLESALNILGSSVAKSFIKYINDGIDPPNTEATLDKKLSDKPLIDSGDLRDHISYKIIK
jgi:hypothetical protein